MPQVISNDGTTAIVMGDDGQIHQVAVNALAPAMQQQFQTPAPPTPTSSGLGDVVRTLQQVAPVKPSFPTPQQSPSPSIPPDFASKINQPGGHLPTTPQQGQPFGFGVNQSAPRVPAAPQPAAAPMKPEELSFLAADKTPAGAKVFGGISGYGLERKGIRDEANAQSAGDKQLGQIYADQASQEDALSKDYRAKKDQTFANEDSAIATFGQMKDDLANSRIDPDRLTHNMHTWQKILAGVSIGLGAVGGALQHTGENSAMDIIQREIDRDVDAQKAALQGKAAALANQVTLVGMYHQKGLSLDQAADFARTTLLEATKLRVQQVMTGVDDSVAQAKAEQVIGQLDERIAAMADQHDLQERMIAAKAINNPDARKNAQAMAIVNDVSNEYFQKIGPGASVSQWFPSDAKQYNDKVDQAAKLLRGKLGKLTVDQIKEMFPTPGMSRGRAEAKLQSLSHLLNEGGVGGNDMQPVDGEGE